MGSWLPYHRTRNIPSIGGEKWDEKAPIHCAWTTHLKRTAHIGRLCSPKLLSFPRVFVHLDFPRGCFVLPLQRILSSHCLPSASEAHFHNPGPLRSALNWYCTVETDGTIFSSETTCTPFRIVWGTWRSEPFWFSWSLLLASWFQWWWGKLFKDNHLHEMLLNLVHPWRDGAPGEKNWLQTVVHRNQGWKPPSVHTEYEMRKQQKTFAWSREGRNGGQVCTFISGPGTSVCSALSVSSVIQVGMSSHRFRAFAICVCVCVWYPITKELAPTDCPSPTLSPLKPLPPLVTKRLRHPKTVQRLPYLIPPLLLVNPGCSLFLDSHRLWGNSELNLKSIPAKTAPPSFKTHPGQLPSLFREAHSVFLAPLPEDIFEII